jgi:putative colanic acid biosynthesis UDP-glucose lipid carrier transferase
VFYRQKLVVLNNRSFGMIKFRSMPVDVEKDGLRWAGALTRPPRVLGSSFSNLA